MNNYFRNMSFIPLQSPKKMKSTEKPIKGTFRRVIAHDGCEGAAKVQSPAEQRGSLWKDIPRTVPRSIVALGLASSSCVFHPPPPLAEELAEAQMVTQVAQPDPKVAKSGGKPHAEAATGSGSSDSVQPGEAQSSPSQKEPSSTSDSESTTTPSVTSAQSARNGASFGREQRMKGEPLKAGMSIEEIKAFNHEQGDPFAAGFPLELALDGVEGEGKLWVELNTNKGTIDCRLYEKQCPWTVANFVGLARGVRPFYDRKSQSWNKQPYLDGSEFHRVIPGFMIQGGDLSATGMGNPGYVIVDEFNENFSFNRPGLLAMANRGPSTGGSQFFITLGPASHLNQLHTIFGECSESGIKVAEAIAGVPRGDMDRPNESQEILSVKVLRR